MRPTTPPLSRHWRDGLIHGRRRRLWYLELHLPPLAVNTPDWLFVGATVFDERRQCWGTVMDLGWPPDLRQLNRAWLRPPPGGREWNPRIDHLSPHNPAPVLTDKPCTGDCP
ncbi:hypothetical protein [Streptomyces justiciae]|uniref:hypothetical protein n=1 Tax=Streptomyces justiciae TaxID=2780140 RepID=UPI002117BB21|nr:hypothetical protein [Streptomyces justiciae]MCW8383960.1 hypothetical protein [Streptomyces justiciae]